jgi:hypothetical protein
MRAFELPQEAINTFLKSGKLEEGSVLFDAWTAVDVDHDGVLTWDEIWKGFEPL